MQELLRSNDLVLLSFVQDLLNQSGIDPFLFDTHSAIMDGGVPFVQQRIMVAAKDWDKAKEILSQNGIGGS